MQGFGDARDKCPRSQELFFRGIRDVGDFRQNARHARKAEHIKRRGLHAMIDQGIVPIQIGDHGFFGIPGQLERVPLASALLAHRLDYEKRGQGFFDAVQNARIVRAAEEYYRIMYYGSAASWNLRDRHMFDTLLALLEHRGPEARAAVWEHNSHVGNAAATEMGVRSKEPCASRRASACGSHRR